MKRRNSVISVGRDRAEVKIYTLRNREGYESFQCCWYELGRRQSKTFGDLKDAKLFAQQKTVALSNGLSKIDQATLRDVEVFKDCENRIARFGFSLPAIVEEWISSREQLPDVPLSELIQFYKRHHNGIPRITVAEVRDLFLDAKKAALVSSTYLRVSRCQLKRFVEEFGASQIADITTAEIDGYLRRINGEGVYKNNIRGTITTLFTWAREQGYLEEDRKTAPERAMTFLVPDSAPAIWTPTEMRRLLEVCPRRLVPLLVIGAFTGIRSAEVNRLEWEDFLWDRGFVEVKAKKAKTKARRLVPITENLKLWLAPFRKEQGPVCRLNNQSGTLHYIGEKSGLGWRQNALRHSYASYRLAEIQNAAQVSLEMGNSPAKLFKHYRELVTPDQAKEWFSILPPAGWEGNAQIASTKRWKKRVTVPACVDTAQAA
jgi:integrase